MKEFLAQEAANSKVKPGILPEAIFEFLWYDPSVEEREFDDLPLARYFEDLGLLALRSSWQRDARVFSIKCGAPGGAKHGGKAGRSCKTRGSICFLCLTITPTICPIFLPAAANISPVRTVTTAI